MSIEGLTARQVTLCDLLWKTEDVYALMNNVYDEELRKELLTLTQLMIMDQFDDEVVLNSMGLREEVENIFNKMKNNPLQPPNNVL
jgi:hypothetical protein